MEIAQIKARLPIAQVLNHYGLDIDKNNRLCCPFHADKTPSMQVYPDTNRCYCFSSHCKTHGKTIDVIDFIQLQENTSKHQAIVKAKTLISPGYTRPVAPPTATAEPRPGILEQLEKTFMAGIYNSLPARNYCQSRALDLQKLKGFVGFNSGQFHHAGRFKQGEEPCKTQLIQDCLAIGMLKALTHPNNRTGQATGYQVFAKNALVFFLRNTQGKPVGLYGRSIHPTSQARHYYLKNRQGLYPGYPDRSTTHLLLTESIIDCATLQQADLPKNYSLLALYGTNGLTPEHRQCLRELPNLKEIIFCLDNDQPGRKATAKYARELTPLNLTFSTLELPDKDINQVAQTHQDITLFNQLLTRRKPFLDAPLLDTPQPAKEQLPTPAAPSLAIGPPLQAPPLTLEQINTLIGQSGIIGEENSRLLLFIIASSYKTQKPLHAIVQGSSGSGKTHLISKIADLMPPEDVLRFTRITESALYNFSQGMLVGKLLVIEDLDGLKEEALLAFRELVSNHQVSSGISVKDKKGNIKSTTKVVRGIFSSLSATTKGSIYEDNMNRSFLLAVDESPAQSHKIIQYQNQRYAGKIPLVREKQAIEALQQCIRNLQNLPVINPYATLLQLPDTVHKKRRLNQMFQSIIKQITLLNQKHRPLQNNALYTRVEDIALAIDILFDSIVLKIDELEGGQRLFYQNLFKAFGNESFTRFQAMEVTGLKKTQLQHHLNHLVQLEYLRQFGFSNRGFTYKIGFQDNIDKVRADLKQHFNDQLKNLPATGTPNATERQRTPTERQTNTRTT